MKVFKRLTTALITGAFLFAASPSYAGYYGHHSGYSVGYGAGFGHHYGGHFSYYSHGHGSELGYALLGLTGLVLLTQLFYQPEPRYYERPRVYYPPRTTYVPTQRVPAPVTRTVYRKPVTPVYKDSAGWEQLATGNINQAQDIFAVQSQQNLNSGTYKIGFALAAAMNGDLERGTRSMRRAMRIDPDSINNINFNDDISSKLMMLSEDYQAEDQTFMIAALSFMQKDYTRANEAINNAMAAGDHSQSTRNLKHVIDEALNI